MEAVRFDNWLGGLNESTPSAKLGVNELNTNVNWDYSDDGSLAMRPGSERYTDVVGAADNIQSMRRIYYSGDTLQRFLCSHGRKIGTVSDEGVVADVNGAGTPPGAGYTNTGADHFSAAGAAQRIDWAQEYDNVFIANGVDVIRMYDAVANEIYYINSGNCPAPVAINFFEGRLFALNGGVAGEYQRLFYAGRGTPDVWNALDFLDFRTPKGGQGRALITRDDHQVVFFSDSIYAVYGSSKETFVVVEISAEVGAVGPGAVTTNEDGLIEFIGHNGIYVLIGNRVLLASRKVSPRFNSTILIGEAVYDKATRCMLARIDGNQALIHSHRGAPIIDAEMGRIEMGPWGVREYAAGVINCWCAWGGPADNNEVFFAVGVHIYKLTGTLDETIEAYKTPTSLVQAAGTATATFAAAHGYSNGDLIEITGASVAEYNGVHTIENVAALTFDFPIDAGAGSPATGASVARVYLNDIASRARTGDFDPSGDANMSRARWLYIDHNGSDELVINIIREYGLTQLPVIVLGSGSGAVLVWGGGNWGEDLWAFDIATPERASMTELLFAHRFAVEVVSISSFGHAVYRMRVDFITREMEVFS